MNTIRSNHSLLLLAISLATFAAIASSHAEDQAFDWDNLVSDIHGVAPFTDENLVNPWGVAAGPRDTFWVANAGSGTITVYNGKGRPPTDYALVVTVPVPPGSPPNAVAAPTGIVFNPRALKSDSGHDFVISSGKESGPSIYLTATEEGTIAGYNPAVNQTNAIIAVNNSATGAIYKGLALGWDGAGHHRLYAANFHAGTVEVFGTNFQPLVVAGGFVEPAPVPGFAPFNIIPFAPGKDEEIMRYLIVAYAKQDADAEDDETGPGNGYINLFDRDGRFVKQLVSYVPPTAANPKGNHLDSPWGMVVASSPFADVRKVLLVGNFGDGTIRRFSLVDLSGAPLGALRDRHGELLRFEGLWGLQFRLSHDPTKSGNDTGETEPELYFAAGIVGEEHGLFGKIAPR